MSKAAPERPEVPVVLWQETLPTYIYGELSADAQRVAQAKHILFRDTLEVIIKAAAYAAGLHIIPSRTLSRNFGPKQPPFEDDWTAHICPEGTSTEALIDFNYGVWLSVYGDDSLEGAFRRSSIMLGRSSVIDETIIPKTQDIGRLVFPDMENGVMPGTYWLPNPDRLDAPVWPKLPS